MTRRSGSVSPLAILLVLSLAATTGCSSCERRQVPDAQPPPAKKTVLVLGTTYEPDTLDPVFTEVSGAQEIVRLLFADLTTYDDAWNVQPELTEKLPEARTSTDGALIVDWTLKPGLRWDDGEPLTAKDVVFGHSVEADPKLDAASAAYAQKVRSIVPVDERRFRVTWRRPTIDFLAPRVHAVLPAHAYPARTQKPFRGMGAEPRASGPYRLKSWTKGQQLVVERNPHWPGPKPAIDEIMWRFFGSEDTFEAELKTGGIDALGEASGLTLERARDMAKRLPNHKAYFVDSGVWLHLDMRLDHPLTKRLEIRQAIDAALDRKRLVDLMYGGAATPAFGCFPPRHPAFTQTATRATGLAIARRYLQSITFENRPLELNFATGSQASERGAVYIQSRLAKIGLKVELKAVPFRVLFSKMREKKQAPMALYAWRISADWDVRSVLHTKGGQNFVGLSDPEIDRLYDTMGAALGPAVEGPWGGPEARQAWAKRLAAVEARYRAILPSIPLVFRQSVSIAPKNLENWRPTGATTPVTWNAHEWRRKP